eukprot:GGOE01005828.1.p2 GENE.GGOE01005828.1~~GGOE01005828.1.p2  ORF type:complete len:223 (-),score=64.38 GGOE01005828.1:289-957(-)
MPAITLTYFALAGAAEKVRLALALAGIPFEDKRIAFDEWPKVKPTMKYGQLPKLTLDGKEIYQSEAMLRYIGKLHPNLYPADKALAIDEAIGLTNDLLRAWTPVIYIVMRPTMFGYPEDYIKTDAGQATQKAMKERFATTDLPQFLGYFSALLDGHSFLVGDEPTIADCMLVPTLQFLMNNHIPISHLPSTCLDSHPAIKAYIDRFLALPSVKEFYNKLQKP